MVAPRAAFVSQRTSLDLLGIPRDRYLALVRAPGFPLPVTPIGKLRMVDTEAMIAYLRALGAAPPNLNREEHPVENDTDLAAEPSPESEDSAARKLGSDLGFTFTDQPASDAPASRRRSRR
ncbi:hypothetical protein [Polyangium jinanense]|uniref:Uncharacterized protein n=1 Tax=Polyangium jinanense TaxID=2829994 RepID=A0A9X3WZW3_9BACT|nr:hypothetical protein [Polyangium jinanense]MDC3979798.1 hypothetical protein [Polyangium jinanense]